MNLGELQRVMGDRETWWLQSMALQRVRHDLVTERQQE